MRLDELKNIPNTFQTPLTWFKFITGEWYAQGDRLKGKKRKSECLQNKEMSEQEKSTKTEQTVETVASLSNRICNALKFAKEIKHKFGNTAFYPPQQLW